MENFSNLAFSDLSTAITDSNATTIYVTDSSSFPSDNFRILIDNEIIFVGINSTNTFSNCIRECETGSRVKTTHVINTKVKHVLSVTGMKEFVVQNCPRDVVFGITGNFVVQTVTPLINRVQIIKTSTINSGTGMVLTNPTGANGVFSVCKTVTNGTYDVNLVVVKFVIATTGIVTTYYAGDGTNCPGTTTANLSFVLGDYLTIYCNQIGSSISGADGVFTLTII